MTQNTICVIIRLSKNTISLQPNDIMLLGTSQYKSYYFFTKDKQRLQRGEMYESNTRHNKQSH